MAAPRQMESLHAERGAEPPQAKKEEGTRGSAPHCMRANGTRNPRRARAAEPGQLPLPPPPSRASPLSSSSSSRARQPAATRDASARHRRTQGAAPHRLPRGRRAQQPGPPQPGPSPAPMAAAAVAEPPPPPTPRPCQRRARGPGRAVSS